MGLRGPAAKPTALKLIDGNPGRRKISLNEPKPSRVERLDPPDWLDENLKTVWRTISNELIRLGLLTELDTVAFARYMDTLWEYQYAKQRIGNNLIIGKLDKEGKVIQETLRPHPYLKIKNAAAERLLRLEREFGLTPAARVRMIAIAEGALKPNADPYGTEE